MVLASYWPVVEAGFVWDDDAYVHENPNLRSLEGLRRIWLEPTTSPQYYPVVFTSFWIEYHLWGVQPLGYHVVNVLLHAANAILLWGFLSRLKLPGAFLAAAIFAIHPVQVESVAWVTERKNVLSGFWYLLALHLFWSIADAAEVGSATRRRMTYAASLSAFVCAVLSKSVTASLPAAIAVLLWWRNGRVTRRQGLLLAPYLILGCAAGLHTAYLEVHHVGALGAEWNWTFWERCLIAGRVPWFYLGKLAWPHPLIFIYPKWEIDAHSLRQAAYPASVLLLIATLWWQRLRWGRGPLAAVLLFGGTLFPVLGFADVYPMRFSFVADHFQYLASIGVIVLAAASCATFVRRRQVPQVVAGSAATAVLLALGGTTWLRCFDYRDRETLWTATMLDNPDCWLAPLHLAHLRFDQGRIDEAALLFGRVVDLKSGQPIEPAEMSDLHAWLARCHTVLRHPLQAEHHRRESHKYMQQLVGDPFQNQFDVHFGCGILHRRFREFDEANRAFLRALEIDPLHAECNCELGELLLNAGRYDESVACLQRALQGDPRHLRAQLLLAQVYQEQGKLSEARQAAEAAVDIRPDYLPARMLLDRLQAAAPP